MTKRRRPAKGNKTGVVLFIAIAIGCGVVFALLRAKKPQDAPATPVKEELPGSSPAEVPSPASEPVSPPSVVPTVTTPASIPLPAVRKQSKQEQYEDELAQLERDYKNDLALAMEEEMQTYAQLLKDNAKQEVISAHVKEAKRISDAIILKYHDLSTELSYKYGRISQKDYDSWLKAKSRVK